MQTEDFPKLIELASEAELSLFFASGTGLGAPLLALIVIAFIFSKPFSKVKLVNLARAWRGKPPK